MVQPSAGVLHLAPSSRNTNRERESRATWLWRSLNHIIIYSIYVTVMVLPQAKGPQLRSNIKAATEGSTVTLVLKLPLELYDFVLLISYHGDQVSIALWCLVRTFL